MPIEAKTFWRNNNQEENVSINAERNKKKMTFLQKTNIVGWTYSMSIVTKVQVKNAQMYHHTCFILKLQHKAKLGNA